MVVEIVYDVSLEGHGIYANGHAEQISHTRDLGKPGTSLEVEIRYWSVDLLIVDERVGMHRHCKVVTKEVLWTEGVSDPFEQALLGRWWGTPEVLDRRAYVDAVLRAIISAYDRRGCFPAPGPRIVVADSRTHLVGIPDVDIADLIRQGIVGPG